jgi:CheY-like chemotaxis protein
MRTKILWIDDEPAAVSYERKLVEQRGFEIVTSLTMEDALEKASNLAFKLVLLDLILPRNDYERERGVVDVEAGLSVLTALRDQKWKGATNNTVRIIVVTAVVSADIQARAHEYLNDQRDYLTKSLHRRGQDFMGTINRILFEEGINTDISDQDK